MTDSGAGKCSKCSAVLDPGAAFCAECGHAVAAQEAPAAETAPAFGGRYLERDRSSRLKRASTWLLILSILFAVFGTVLGFHHRSEADKAKEQLALVDPSEVLMVEGETYTVDELIRMVDREVQLIFVLNYFLAAVMLGLFFWSRRAPFPAMVTALCVYLAVIVLNAVMDPKTLYQGILFKIIFIGALVAGIRGALEQRDEQQRSTGAAADGPPA
jgi:hypothetical protein